MGDHSTSINGHLAYITQKEVRWIGKMITDYPKINKVLAPVKIVVQYVNIFYTIEFY